MARELHDNVGHHLTALIIQLDIARRSTNHAQTDPIEQSYLQAKELLASVREVVSSKRSTSALNLNAALGELCHKLPRIHCQLQCDDNVTITNIAKAQCLLRCSQEAISNTLKHSFAGTIRLHLFQQNSLYIMEIEDDGGTTGDVLAGNGLNGMRERCEELSGTLSYTASAQGFTLRIELPHD
jgi:signal transduction histidine kinase